MKPITLLRLKDLYKLNDLEADEHSLLSIIDSIIEKRRQEQEDSFNKQIMSTREYYNLFPNW